MILETICIYNINKNLWYNNQTNNTTVYNKTSGNIFPSNSRREVSREANGKAKRNKSSPDTTRINLFNSHWIQSTESSSNGWTTTSTAAEHGHRLIEFWGSACPSGELDSIIYYFKVCDCESSGWLLSKIATSLSIQEEGRFATTRRRHGWTVWWIARSTLQRIPRNTEHVWRRSVSLEAEVYMKCSCWRRFAKVS